MKKFAKLMALALALVMVLSLAACGGKAPADNGGAKTYTIGINTWGSGVPVLHQEIP